jgi:coenzyme F420 hydrogenase subunit beta
MVINSDGYLRPTKAINDNISNSCPSINVQHFNSDADYHKLWGPIISCNTAFSTKSAIRQKSSSGGVITALATLLLEKEFVDEIIQVGVDDQNPIRNKTHFVTTTEQLLANAGSRYCPSSPLSDIRQVLNNGKKYAVIGKPCDISAIRSLVTKNPEYKEQFPYLLSFMCAGIPSENATKKLLDKLNVKEEDLISFKYRGDGWPGLTCAQTNNNEKFTMSYNESWGGVLNRYLQPRCKVCADGIGEAADIVCGDAWYNSENGYPSFEEKDGRSLTIARTFAGQKLIDEAIQLQALQVDSYDIDNIDSIQPFQKNRKQTIAIRKLALLILGGRTPKFIGYQLYSNMFDSRFNNLIRTFTGTLLRKLKGRV